MAPRIRIAAAILSSAALALVPMGCAPPMPGDEGGGSAESGQITVAPSSPMAAHWVQFAVAEELGYFDEAGLNVNLEFPGGSADVLQALSTGNVDIAGPTPEAVYSAVDKGQSVRMFYNWTRQAVQSLGVQESSPVESFADLEGKTIGVSTLASGAKLLAEAGLRDAGVDPANVTFIAVGTGVAAMDALTRGSVDALMLWDTEYTMMEQSGTPIRTILPDDLAQLYSTGFAARNETIESNPEMLEGFGHAWAKATVWSTENPEAAVEILWEHYPEVKTSDSPDALGEQVEIFESRNEAAMAGDPIENGKLGSFSKDSVESWSTFAQEYGITPERIPADQVYTNEFVESFNDFDVEQVRDDARSR